MTFLSKNKQMKTKSEVGPSLQNGCSCRRRGVTKHKPHPYSLDHSLCLSSLLILVFTWRSLGLIYLLTVNFGFITCFSLSKVPTVIDVSILQRTLLLPCSNSCSFSLHPNSLIHTSSPYVNQFFLTLSGFNEVFPIKI